MPTQTPHLDQAAELLAELNAHPRHARDHYAGPLNEFVGEHLDALVEEKRESAIAVRDRFVAALEEVGAAEAEYTRELNSWRRPFGVDLRLPPSKVTPDRLEELHDTRGVICSGAASAAGRAKGSGLPLPVPLYYDPEETERAEKEARGEIKTAPRINGWARR